MWKNDKKEEAFCPENTQADIAGAHDHVSAVAAVIFLLPTVLTITNSLCPTEINANYGVVFNSVTDSKTFISKTVNLKFIPDIVSFSQYFSVLFKTPIIC